MLCCSVLECCSSCCSVSCFRQYTLAWLRGRGRKRSGKAGLLADLFARDPAGPTKNGEVTSWYDEKHKIQKHSWGMLCPGFVRKHVPSVVLNIKNRTKDLSRVFPGPDLVYPFLLQWKSQKLTGHRRDASYFPPNLLFCGLTDWVLFLFFPHW